MNRNSQSSVMKVGALRSAAPMALLASLALAGCSTTLAAPPIAYDDVAVPAVLEKEPKKPVKGNRPIATRHFLYD